MRHFDEELENLKNKLLEMSGLVEAAVYRSVSSVIDRDIVQAQSVIGGEKRVNQLQVEIDELAIALLALQAPVGGDLRLIAVALKINNDLERMGDLAVRIARNGLTLAKVPPTHPDIDIPLLASKVQVMVRKSLDSFVQRDSSLARNVLESDDEVDRLRDSQVKELISFMQRQPQQIRETVDLLSIVRLLERIADHATNIAEDVVYLINGVDVRHTPHRAASG